jgi:hypothetical protein
MNSNTINDTTFTLRQDGTLVAVTSVDYDSATKTATLTPVADLLPGTPYNATISSTVENINGDTPLAANYAWSFTASPEMSLVSMSTSEIVGNNRSDISNIDATGRYVVFESTATNLVANISTNGLNQIYRKDTVTGDVILVSSDSTNLLAANNACFAPAISDNGRFVVFQSAATNLSSIPTGGTQQIYIKDLADGTTELVSRDATGTTVANTSAANPVVSSDGRFVVFESSATNLSALPANGVTQIYRKDMSDDTVDMVSLETTLNGGAAGFSGNTDMSNDGRFIVFESNAQNLVLPAPTAFNHIYFVDMNTPDSIEQISVNTAGSDDVASSFNPSVSDDGRFVVFESNATNLATPDSNGTTDIFLRDRSLPSTTLVSVNPATGDSADNSSTNGSISSDGSYVAFQSRALDLVSGDNPGLIDIYVRNVSLPTITIDQINIPETGIPDPTVDSGRAVISKDGRYVSFDSVHKYTPEDTNGLFDVYRAYNRTYQ